MVYGVVERGCGVVWQLISPPWVTFTQLMARLEAGIGLVGHWLPEKFADAVETRSCQGELFGPESSKKVTDCVACVPPGVEMKVSGVETVVAAIKGRWIRLVQAMG